MAQKLTGHLVREIVVRGSRGGPLAPLASQLSDDLTYLHGRQVEGKVDRLDDKLRQVLARWAAPAQWRRRQLRWPSCPP